MPTQYIEKEIDIVIDLGVAEVTLQDIPIFATVDISDETDWEPASCEIHIDMILSGYDIVTMVQEELTTQGLLVPHNLRSFAGKFLQQVKEQAREQL